MSEARQICEQPEDLLYDHAAQVVERECEHLRQWRGSTPTVGLALSGGGIRSASFCLGVLQALAHARALPRIDYLSTVSGGGYIGASLTYLLNTATPGFDVSREGFPYVSYPMVNVAPPQTDDAGEARLKGRLLRRLRQNASFLAPGNGITLLSLAGVLLRNLAASLVVHVSLLLLMFVALVGAGLLPAAEPFTGHAVAGMDWPGANPALRLAGAALLAWAALSVLYLMATRAFDRLEALGVPADGSAPSRSLPYRLRRAYDRGIHLLFVLALAAAVLGLLPWLQHLLSSQDRLDALFKWLRDLTSNKPAATGAVAALLGVAGNLWGLRQARSDKPPRLPTAWLVAFASALLLLGVLLLVYAATAPLAGHFGPAAVAALAALLLLGWLPSANYASLHRYYRDRLMELFLPDLDRLRAAMQGDGDGTAAVGPTAAGDATLLGRLCRLPHPGAPPDPLRGPYPLINTNVVLVASKHPRFRGRGGDSFIFSPLFTGSRATGWSETESSPRRGFTLATAMAISGAALNPNAGPGGEGVTRQPVLSVLMGMLNLRLGYWVENPRAGGNAALRGLFGPNLLWPGLAETFGRSNLHEHAQHLLLTDGGHFENLGLYELVRRRLPLIVACDATADPHYGFADLANAIEKVRADFGAIVDFGPQAPADLVAPEKGEAKRPYLIGRITYSLRRTAAGIVPEHGVLVFLKSAFFAGLTADLLGYRRAHPSFPNQSTGDQFFDEKQFEAYRELGYQTAYTMLEDLRRDDPNTQVAQLKEQAARRLWS